MVRGGRVRDCSVKPTARVGIVGRKGEDLQRKARAAGNAHVIQLIEKNTLNNLQSRHYKKRRQPSEGSSLIPIKNKL